MLSPMKTRTASNAPASWQPAAQNLLQRKCSCGNKAGAEGECEECRKKKGMLQRREANNSSPSFFAGHDFSRVAVSLQPKLVINQPGDVYEQEADRIAAAVVSERAEPQSLITQMRSSSLAQRKATIAAQMESDVPPIVHEVLRSPGRPLDQATRAFMEPRFGHDFSNVRVHTDAKAAESARAVNAKAYTVGKDVVFGGGQFEASSHEGRKLMAHELTHVVQQTNSSATGIQRRISYELQDAPEPTMSDPENLSEDEARVKLWLEKYAAEIVAAEETFRIDRRAIAGAIAWEALENWSPMGIKSVGPGKVHTKTSINPFESSDETVAKQTEDVGILPQKSLEDREKALKAPSGAITYIAGIMTAFAEEAARPHSSGWEGEDIRCRPEILTNAYQGDDLKTWKDRLDKKKPGEALRPGNSMAVWVQNNLQYLEAAVGQPDTSICPMLQTQGDPKAQKQGSDEAPGKRGKESSPSPKKSLLEPRQPHDAAPAVDSSAADKDSDVDSILSSVSTAYKEYTQKSKTAAKKFGELKKRAKTIADIQKLELDIQKLQKEIQGLQASMSTARTQKEKKAIEQKIKAKTKEIEKLLTKLLSAKSGKELDQLRAEKASFIEEKYKPMKVERLQYEENLVIAIQNARAEIEKLDDPVVRGSAYVKLNEYTPYHSQQENVDVLHKADSTAASRTCNVTSVAMVLQALGKTASDYKSGNRDDEKMLRIAAAYKDVLMERGELTDLMKLRLPDFLQIVAVEHYLTGFGNEKIEIEKAGEEAVKHNTSMDFLVNILKDFGTEAKDYYHPAANQLSAFGTTSREAKNRSKKSSARDEGKQKASKDELVEVGKIGEIALNGLMNLNEALKKNESATGGEIENLINTEIRLIEDKIKDSPLIDKKSGKAMKNNIQRIQKKLSKFAAEITKAEKSKMKAEKLKKTITSKFNGIKKTLQGEIKAIQNKDEVKNLKYYEASGTPKEMQESLPMVDYQKGFLKNVSDSVQSGHQVIVNLVGHYVRLQSIDVDKIVVDDPFFAESFSVTWDEALADGYFRHYIIIKPK